MVADFSRTHFINDIINKKSFQQFIIMLLKTFSLYLIFILSRKNKQTYIKIYNDLKKIFKKSIKNSQNVI